MTDIGWSLEERKGLLMVPVRLQAWRTEQIMAFFIELVYLEEGARKMLGQQRQWDS